MSPTPSPSPEPYPADRAVPRDHPGADRLNAAYRSALAAERAGDLDGAERILRDLAEAAPESHAVWHRLGLIAMRRGDPALAAERLERAAGSGRAEHLTALGDAYRAAQRLAEAERPYRAALEAAPGHAPALLGLGIVLVGLGRLEEGVARLRDCVRRLPRHPVTHTNLGNGLLAAGDAEDALDAYDRALALEPDFPLALANRASALIALGRADEAAESARRALRRNPGHLTAHLNLGYALSMIGEAPEAARAFRAVLDLAPGHAAAQYFLAAIEEGAPPPQAPADYMREVFDQQAGAFERHLVQTLRYKAPAVLAELAREAGAGDGLAVLDIGCGTGLVGAAVHDMAARLEGIDLSPRMLEQAQRRGIYDALHAGDAVEVMERLETRFDLVAAADVFIYIGDLAPVLTAARRLATPQARLVFSVESEAGEGYVLQPSGRYAHAARYVETTAAAASWRPVAERPFDIRLEGERAVPGRAYAMAPAG